MYTINDVITQIAVLRYNPVGFTNAIKAKKQIQECMLQYVTEAERSMLAKNIVAETLVEKVKNSGKYHLNQSLKTTQDIFIIAMAIGTILKELDNENEKYVSYQSIANIMNELIC